MRLNTNTSEIAQTHYQLIVEENDRQTFSYDEEITELATGRDSIKSNVISLAHLLIKNGAGI